MQPATREVWQDHEVTLSLLYSIAVAVSLVALGVFLVAFRFALREATSEDHGRHTDSLPRARVRGARLWSRNRWHWIS